MASEDVHEVPTALLRLSLGMSVALAATGRTQKEVAEVCGISTAYLSKMLAGQKNPSQVVIERFANALGCRISEIYDLGDKALERRERAALQAAERRAAEERTVESIVEVAGRLGPEDLKKLRDEVDRLVAEGIAGRASGGAQG